MKETQWLDLADAYAFLGNSLLAPMSQTESLGLSPELWEAMPSMGEASLEDELFSMAEFVGAFADEEDAVRQVSVEWTHLFVGPPKPACPPWETYYRREGVTNGFGAATFEMREVLRELGLKADGPSNQFEDHVGIELLALSEMCRRLAAGETSEKLNEASVAEFLAMHPAFWISRLAEAVSGECPDGYYARLLGYTACLISWCEAQFRA